MAIVTGLFIYPVKSCGGIKLSEAHLLETGLAHDRQWMLVDADGRFVTQRTHPAMALIQTTLEGDVLRLRAPGMGTDIEVPVCCAPSAFGGVPQRGADAGGRASCQRMAEPVPGAADAAGAG